MLEYPEKVAVKQDDESQDLQSGPSNLLVRVMKSELPKSNNPLSFGALTDFIAALLDVSVIDDVEELIDEGVSYLLNVSWRGWETGRDKFVAKYVGNAWEQFLATRTKIADFGNQVKFDTTENQHYVVGL